MVRRACTCLAGEAGFVTICTQNREHHFGEVIAGEMKLSPIGEVAHSEWHLTPGLRPDMNLALGEFVVMPNHIHGMVIIGENEYNSQAFDGKGTNTNTPATPKNQFGPQRKNLASIMRGYKSAVTTYARKNEINFAWQSRFHDHIIRSQDDYERISAYIVNNPKNWVQDKFYAV